MVRKSFNYIEGWMYSLEVMDESDCFYLGVFNWVIVEWKGDFKINVYMIYIV